MATASRVLNNPGAVKNATRARVIRVMEELNYSPNMHARNLAAGGARSIGVILSSLKNPFFVDIYGALEEGVQRAGFDLFLASTEYSSERLLSGIRLMMSRRVAGLAVITSELTPYLNNETVHEQIPMVFCDANSNRGNRINIRVDYRRGMRKLAAYLKDLGHRRVGIVGHDAELGTAATRTAKMLDAARLSGLQIETTTDTDSLDGGRRAARSLLKAQPRVTVIVCVNDLMAIGATRELHEQGIRVPQDVSVTGFDNIAWGEFCNPALTTVHVPRDKIGQMICESLTNTRYAQRHAEYIIDPELVIRESTGPARSV